LQVYVSSREQLISVDPLTKLNNRMEMVRYLDNKMKNRSPGKDLYLFIMDLDYFKKINDKYGHTEGDIAITIVADALRNIVRKTNFFVCRYGGDEFVLIGEVKPDFDPSEIREKINEVLKEEKEKHNKEYTLHMSVGYFKYTPEIHSVAEFVSAADKYLYKQKSDRLLKRSQKEQGEILTEEIDLKSERNVIKKAEKLLTKKEDKTKQ
jgi:diguanylate cyclase (GGDEF)-like protein